MFFYYIYEDTRYLMFSVKFLRNFFLSYHGSSFCVSDSIDEPSEDELAA